MRESFLKFFQQGVWASISGGWYYDSHYSSFANLFHLYSWLFLLCFPFILYLNTPLNWINIISYIVTVVVFFSSIKAVNNYLHHIFDSTNYIEDKEKTSNDDLVDTDVKNDSYHLNPNDHATSQNRVIEDVSAIQAERSSEPNFDYEVACGHKSTWDNVTDISKETFVDDTLKISNVDELWGGDWQMNKETNFADHEKKEISGDGIEDETKKLQKVKQTHKSARSKKTSSKHATVEHCISITSLSSSSEFEDLPCDFPSISGDEQDPDPNQPSTSQGIHHRSSMKRRVGFRSHTRPSLHKRHLTYLAEHTSDVNDESQSETIVAKEHGSSDWQKSGKELGDFACLFELNQNDEKSKGVPAADGDASNIIESEIKKKASDKTTMNDSAIVQVQNINESKTENAGQLQNSNSSSMSCTPLPISDAEEKNSTSKLSGNEAIVIEHNIAIPMEGVKPSLKGDRETLRNDEIDFPLLQETGEEIQPKRKKVRVSRSAPTKIEYVVDLPGSGEDGFGRVVKNKDSDEKIREFIRKKSHSSHHGRALSTTNRQDLFTTKTENNCSDDALESSIDHFKKIHAPFTRRHPTGASQPTKLLDFKTSESSPPLTSEEPRSSNDSRRTSAQPKLHLATDFADTSEGAVHGYLDPEGNYYAYAFTSEGQNVTQELRGNDPLLQINRRSRRRTGESSSSASTSNQPRSLLDEYLTLNDRSLLERHRISRQSSRIRRFSRQSEAQFIMNLLQRSIDNPHRYSVNSSLPSQLDLSGRAVTPKPKIRYNVKIPFKTITIQYDRLALVDLLDRNFLTAESILCVVLAAIIGGLGMYILTLPLLHDIWTFWLCLVIATSQYSLIKSVQPDSASPTHGHNRIIAYSRPLYFIGSASLLILFNFLSDEKNIQLNGIPFYDLKIFDNAGFVFGRDFMIVFTLLLPVIFLFGLLPQTNTLLIFACEQIEIHLFGGTASTSVSASFFSLGRSIMLSLFLYGFCYGAVVSQEKGQSILYSAFCGFLIPLSYHLSRQTSSPTIFWSIIKSKLFNNDEKTVEDDPAKEADSVSERYLHTALTARLESDVILMPIVCIIAFALHSTSIFSTLQFPFTVILLALVCVFGFFLHYLLPQLRKNVPWLLFAKPILLSHEFNLFEVTESARLMWFEKMFVILSFLEKNIIIPVYIMNELTKQVEPITLIYGNALGSAVLTLVGIKLFRSAFTFPSNQYLVYVLSYLFVHYDYPEYANYILITYFFAGICLIKLQELILKLQFFFIYISPWQMSWGSTFHAFAQPFAVPHSAIMIVQAVLASIIQAPFVPFLGSAIFHSSYARPLKFWEKNYNTKRVDHSNTRLASQIDQVAQSDDNNLNAVFYEHLTCSLQKSLAGDIALGRWGNVVSGDCFILASDNLNAMVHVIEKGNEVITFQLRGLEFGGTYCQQREVEAINEGPNSTEKCCCCSPRNIKGMLSIQSALSQRWLAWQVIATNYSLDGYSISDNNATTMLGVFDLRKILINYIVKSIAYFLIIHDSLEEWVNNASIREQLEVCEQESYVDMDPPFAPSIDDDYDKLLYGVSRSKFCEVYRAWIVYCCQERYKKTNKMIDSGSDSKLVTLCFALSILGRRALGTAAHTLSPNLDGFLRGLHALFKGDYRITSSKDEWIFTDMNLLQQVVAPGVRTALKLHQDHFAASDEYEDYNALYNAIDDYSKNMVIAHEADPAWRRAVLSNTASMLALRRVASESYVDQYSVVTLNHRAIGFKLIKINKECVRGLWAGQQSELIFLRNRNPERGSIQNAKQVLRNMINSSCDQPIGYPIYVSPLTTSFASSNEQYNSVIRGPITFEAVRRCSHRFIACLSESCTGSCNSGGSGGLDQHQPVPLSHFSTISRGTQPPPVPERSSSKQVYASTTFTVPNLSRSDRGSDSSSKSRVSSRQASGSFVVPELTRSSTTQRPTLPTVSRLSSGSSSTEVSSIKRSRQMSHSMNLPPHQSSIKRSTRSISASAQL